MKYLLKIDELYKSTYKSAADKLRGKHQKRSSDIMNWAEEKGESELKKKHIERDYPHAFTFTDDNLSKVYLGKFYITGGTKEKASTWSIPASQIRVTMMGEWGQEITMSLFVYDDDIRTANHKMSVSGKYSVNDFLFNNRKDALEFKKYIVQNIDEMYSKLSVNDLYSTN